jgi:hypothetical protein
VNQLEGYEAATIKRVTEIMQPLLDEAVRMAASEAAGQSALWLRDRTQGEIAHVLAGLLTKELPGFYSLTIETTGDHGELRGTIVYRSGEIAEEEYPGIGEAKRMGREALRRKLAASPPESKEDEESK